MKDDGRGWKRMEEEAGGDWGRQEEDRRARLALRLSAEHVAERKMGYCGIYLL